MMELLKRMDTHYEEIMNIPPVESSIEGIKKAIDLLVLGIQLREAAAENRFTPGILRENITVYTDSPGVYDRTFFVSATCTPETLNVNLYNLLFSTMMTCAIAADVAMDAFGSKIPEATDNLNSARNILYQIRCAFAHGPYQPQWKISEKYQREYTFKFESINVKFNGKEISERSNKQMNPTDFGGYEGYIGLIKFCQKSLEDKLTAPVKDSFLSST